MSKNQPDLSRFDPVEVDLKNPGWAAVLAWLWPGAGHLYQGRYGKAALFMICILGTYFWGLAMGDGHVVYASFREHDRRYEYILQAGVGLPAMPALAQSFLAKKGSLLFGSKFMAPPAALNPRQLHEQLHDEKAEWHGKLGFFFELGTLFTMVAGLLNILAVYDAYAGPMFSLPESQVGIPPPGEEADQKQKPQSGVAGTLELGGIVLGVVGALTLKYRLEIDNLWVSYLFAIIGGVGGAMLGRLLYRALLGATHRESRFAGLNRDEVEPSQ